MWNKHLTQIGGGEDKNQCDETRSNMHDKRSLRVYSFLDNKREIKPTQDASSPTVLRCPASNDQSPLMSNGH